jgi:hypothetical protein
VPLELLAGTVRHFFPKFNRWLAGLYDRRDPRRITYGIEHLVWEELLMFLCGVKSRYAMVSESESPGLLAALLDLSGTGEQAAAHPDSPYAFLSALHPSNLVRFQAKLVRRLMRMRALEQFRFGKEWLVAVDATWLRTYRKEHCKRCLQMVLPDGTKRWMHAVLEAKLILSNGMVISLASVPIENADSAATKQDCEQKAFPRLAAALKKLFPRLPICLTADSLYGTEAVMELCEQMNWSYVAVFKPGRTPALWQRAQRKARRGPTLTVTTPRGTVQTFRWATNLEHGEHITHALFCDETDPDGQVHTWAWLTDHRPDRNSAERIANRGGRPRWKIENEGFNEQKNGEFELKHDYGSKGYCWYNDYLIVQVAHLLIQLVKHGDLIKKLSAGRYRTFREAFRTLKSFVARLRESAQRDRVSNPIKGPDPMHIQIRLDSS